MFYGTVSLYKNINGREVREDREFHDQNEYNSYIHNRKDLHPSFLFPSFFRDFFSDRSAYLSENSEDQFSLPEKTGNIDVYAEEIQKIEQEKEEKKRKKESLQDSHKKLLEYKEIFEKEWRKDMIEKINEDIKQVEEDLKVL